MDCQIELGGWEGTLLLLPSFLPQEEAVSILKTGLKPMSHVSTDLESHLSLAWDIGNFMMLEIFRQK